MAALARSATGSFRDALGTLEQLVTYSGSEIALGDVLAVLGVADARLLAETVDAVAAGDARRALQALSQCAEQGRDAGSFAADLEVRARELLVVQTLGEVPSELSLTPEADSALLEQAAARGPRDGGRAARAAGGRDGGRARGRGPAHAPRARVGQGLPSRAWTARRGRCWRASSAWRRAVARRRRRAQATSERARAAGRQRDRAGV